MHRRKSSLLWLTVVFLLVSQGVLASERVLKVAIPTNPPTLDPYISTTSATRQVAIHVFETLLTYDESYSLIPQLTDYYESTDDNREFTFYLRQGVRFHNGKELTAYDVKASIARFLRVSVRSADLGMIEKIEVIDDYTVRFYLNDGIGAFPFLLANPVTFLAIFPEEIANKEDDELTVNDIIGTGPYKLSQWISDVKLVLTKFEDYSLDTRFSGTGLGGERHAYRDLELIPVTETASRVAGLETGEYDVIENIPAASYDRLSKIDAIELGQAFSSGLIYEINHKDPLTSNVKIRQAILAALNAEEIMIAVTMGRPEFYRLHPSFFVPEQADWHMSEGAEYYNQNNPEKARELLQEAGYTGEKLVLLTNRDYENMYRGTLPLAQQLEQAGFNVVIEVMDWPSQLAKAVSLEGWNVQSSGWTMRPDPSSLNAALTAGTAASYGYNNPEMEKLLQEGLRAGTLEERQAVYKQVQTMMYVDVPVIRLGDQMGLYGWKKGVEGFKPWYTPFYWNVR